jgi:hypothetical protein
MKLTTTIKSLALAACFITGASQAATELIINGNFEADQVARGKALNFDNLKGWTGGAHGIELRNNVAGTASAGKNFVELDTSENSSMWQNIDTVAGQHYTLSFDFMNRPDTGSESNGLEVFWNNASLGTFNNKSKWFTQTIDVVGTGAATKLTFAAIGASDGVGSSLDKVSLISAVPEPESYGMLLAGLGLIGFMARRKAAR